MNAADLLKTAAKSSFYVLSRTLLFFLLGLLLNLLFLLFLRPEINLLTIKFSGPGPAHIGGGIGALLAIFILAFLYWRVILLFLGFGVVFPIGYLILGKKYGVQKAILSAVSGRQKFLTVYLVDRLFDRIQNRTNVLETFSKSEFRTFLHEHLTTYTKKLENMPFLLRLVCKRVLRKWSLLQAVDRTLATLGEDQINIHSFKKTLIEQIDSSLDQRLFSQSYTHLAILVAVNTVVFFAIKFFV